MPLSLGADLAGADDSTLEVLGRIGELAGLVFQIKDDELGLFGDEESLGKPVGSDIREGKKTLYYSFLLARCQGKDRKNVEALFGSPEISREDIDFIRSLVRDLAIQNSIDEITGQLTEECRLLIRDLEVSVESSRKLLEDLVQFNLERKY
jgi:geranylgeranyl diphosphate synthase type I